MQDRKEFLHNFRTKPFNIDKPSKTLKLYNIVITILIFVSLLNFCSNYIMYKAYNRSKQSLQETISKSKAVSTDKAQLTSEREVLKKENERLILDNKRILSEKEKVLSKANEISKNNQKLIDINKDLTKDNLELQNSLKKAASVGIKPQSYMDFNGITLANEVQKWKYAGKFLGTAYTPCKEECGNNKGITNSGRPITPGITVAIDNNYWPFGTVFYVKGLGYVVAMDTGSAIKGRNRFDFAVFSKKFAQKLGKKYWDVYVVKMGDGKVRNTIF